VVSRAERDLIRRFASELDASIGKPGGRLDAPAVKRHHVSRVMNLCGFKHLSRARLDRLTTELAAFGIYADPPLAAPKLRHSTNVTFSRYPGSSHQFTFATEQEFKQFLVHYVAYMSAPFAGLTVGRPPVADAEFRLPSGKRIDILLTNEAEREYVAVELKRGDPGHQGWQQLFEYITEMREHDLDGYQVRGVLVTGPPSSTSVAAFEASGAADDIQWVTYRLNIDFPGARPETSAPSAPA
jgi:hypothetical protein